MVPILCALVVLQAAPQPPITLREARKFVDSAVQWNPPSLKAEENGWDLMQKAIKLIPKPKPGDADASPEDPSALAGLLDKPGQPDIISRSQKALKTYEPALKAIREAIAKPYWYAPSLPADLVPKPFAAAQVDAYPMLAGLKSLGRALILSANLNAKLGKPEVATDDLVLAHRIADRLLESHKDLITTLVGYALESMSDRLIQTVCVNPALGAKDLSRFLESYQERRIGIDLAEALKSEYDSKFVATLAGIEYPSKELMFKYGDDDDISQKLLEGHPNPFDRKATIQLGSMLMQKVIEQTMKPEDEREVLLNIGSDLLTGWPKDLLDQGDELGTGTHKENLSAAQIESCRAALKKIDNPLGKVLVAMTLPVFTQADVADMRAVANSRATKVIVAIQIFARKNGKAPETLDALAQAEILKPVPTDPYTNKPFGYDAKRAVLWSAGPDMADDGGLDKVGANNGKDTVWPTDGKFIR